MKKRTQRCAFCKTASMCDALDLYFCSTHIIRFYLGLKYVGWM